MMLMNATPEQLLAIGNSSPQPPQPPQSSGQPTSYGASRGRSAPYTADTGNMLALGDNGPDSPGALAIEGGRRQALRNDEVGMYVAPPDASNAIEDVHDVPDRESWGNQPDNQQAPAQAIMDK